MGIKDKSIIFACGYYEPTINKRLIKDYPTINPYRKLYDEPQVLPLPDMYGKNLTFKTGGVDGCDCEEVLQLIAQGKIDTTPLITHRFPLSQIEEAYRIFENKEDGVIKIAIEEG